MRGSSHYGPRSGFSYPELGASKNVEPYQDSLDRSQDVSNINCGLEERRIMIGELFRLTQNIEKKFYSDVSKAPTLARYPSVESLTDNQKAPCAPKCQFDP